MPRGEAMARFRVRFVLNVGRQGAPLAKLGRIAEQAGVFLRALAGDCKVATRSDEWLAVNFANGSVEYDAEFQGDVTADEARLFARNLEFLTEFNGEATGLGSSLSHGTALEFSRIGALIDPDETIRVGIYPARGTTLRWRSITYNKAAILRREIETPLAAHGAVQGILHAWFKEAREPCFQLRELATDALVRVFYPPPLYPAVAQAVQERTTVLIVTGDILFNRATRQPIEMRAERIERQRMLSAAEFEGLAGSAPDFVAAADGDDIADEAA
jgi:hypothetical protein